MTGNGDLFAVSREQYGDQYRTDLMTLFRDFVGSAHQVSRLRHQANTFFSSINTVLLVEWQHFKDADGRSLTSIESCVPRLFMGAYIAMALLNFWF